MPWYVNNTLLVLLFALQHSVGTTATAKRLTAKMVGNRPYLWNAVYNIFTVAVIVVMVVFWKSSGIVIWNLPQPWFGILIGVEAVMLFTFFYLFKYTQPFGEWLGYKQVWRMLRRQPEPSGEGYKIKTYGIKRYIRFPHHTVLFIMAWSLPYMTADLLLLSISASVYVWLGSAHQDYRGRTYFHEQWWEYSKNTRMLFPSIEHIIYNVDEKRKARAERAASAPDAVATVARVPEAAQTSQR